MSVFAYAHLARGAGLPLDEFGHVIAWIGRVRGQPGFPAETHPYSIDPHSSGEL